MSTKLFDLIYSANSEEGAWQSIDLAHDIKLALWEAYDPRDDLTYPTISNWDDVLIEAIEEKCFYNLTKEQVLSILFGLHHRNRIVDGLWWSMFETGTAPRLFNQLLKLDSNNV